MPEKLKVGVFDSGVGGPAIVRAIQKELPDLEVIYRDDSEHVPYGNRGVEEIYSFVKPILDSLVTDGCQIIVIACNTVTTNLAKRLRREISVPIIGLEPAVQPAAAASKTGVIAVCATPRTLTSKRYAWLKAEFAKGVRVLEPDCSDWALMIENNQVDREKVADIIESVIADGADQIVLGCTHYHWIEELITKIANSRAVIIQPEKPVVAQLKKVLSKLVN